MQTYSHIKNTENAEQIINSIWSKYLPRITNSIICILSITRFHIYFFFIFESWDTLKLSTQEDNQHIYASLPRGAEARPLHKICKGNKERIINVLLATWNIKILVNPHFPVVLWHCPVYLAFFNWFESQSSPSYSPSPLVAQVDWMNQFLLRRLWSPSLSVTSAAFNAFGKSWKSESIVAWLIATVYSYG